jgi:hypothetical protein
MKVTIVNESKLIGIDGEVFSGLSFDLANDVHAIQWYDTWGEVEHPVALQDGRPVKPANTVITSFVDYEHLIPIWQAAKDAATTALAAALTAAEQPQP